MPNTTHMRIPSNRVRDIERYFHSELADMYPQGEIDSFLLILFEAYLGWDRARLLLHRDDTLNQSDLLKFHWAAEDLKAYRPIQYVVGHTHFCGLRLQVGSGVLIPRPETEEIVGRIKTMTLDPRRILDLCTGSGCIALALADHFRGAQVWGVDLSAEALAVAKSNAVDNRLPVDFVQCDLLTDEPALPCDLFDLIVSNPPYVRQSERGQMSPNVLDYEPSAALFVPDDDPLCFYRAIGQYARCHLAPGGLLVFEINEHLGADTCRLLLQLGFDADLHCDFRGRHRCLTARRSPNH